MTEKFITYDQHALDRMSERGISEAWVQKAICSPDWTEPHETDPKKAYAFLRWPEDGRHVIRVVFSEREDEIHVWTVYPDRSRKRGPRRTQP